MKIENIEKAERLFKQVKKITSEIDELDYALCNKYPQNLNDDIWVGTYNCYVNNIYIQTAIKNNIDGLTLKLNLVENEIKKL